jgi:hypothetical protein
MKQRTIYPFYFLITIFISISLACGLQLGQQQPVAVVEVVQYTATPLPEISMPPSEIPATETPQISHISNPASSPGNGGLVYDVESSGTAPEHRAPYGDSYDINRLERPFQQDMTYIPDADIVTFNVTKDDTWIYVSIQLIGTNPNNPLGINYGVEIDDDADGFGDTIIWARPPYTPEWTASNVQVYLDENHNTGGLSASKSDAPFNADGYEKLIFDGGVGDDPDLAWVRINAGPLATVQIAFKRSLTDGAYMLGVVADAGLKDVGMLDYVDRFTELQAGSPERNEKEYPLKELHSVDNTCREAFGFKPTGEESQLCPRAEPDPKTPGCEDPSQYTDQGSCEAAGCVWRRDSGPILAVFYHCTSP